VSIPSILKKLPKQSQCRAYAEISKTRCKKKAIWGTNYCWQHESKILIPISVGVTFVSFVWTQVFADRFFPSNELVELRSAKFQERKRREREAAKWTKDDVMFSSTAPLRHLTIQIQLLRTMKFEEILPFEIAFEFAAPEAVHDLGFRLFTQDMEGGHDGKRSIAFFTQVSDLSGASMSGYGFSLWENSTDLISVPITLDERFGRFTTIRDFDGIQIEAFLHTNLLQHIKAINLVANDMLLLTSDPNSQKWVQRQFTRPPVGDRATKPIFLGYTDRKWTINLSAAVKNPHLGKATFPEGQSFRRINR
jgi:hypothetical protein